MSDISAVLSFLILKVAGVAGYSTFGGDSALETFPPSISSRPLLDGRASRD